MTVGGAAVRVTTASAGQNGTLTFGGTQNQHVTVHVTNNNEGTVAVKLLSTDGQTQLAASTSLFTSFNLSTVTLPATGTYTIKVDPQNANTGRLDINVTSP